MHLALNNSQFTILHRLISGPIFWSYKTNRSFLTGRIPRRTTTIHLSPWIVVNIEITDCWYIWSYLISCVSGRKVDIKRDVRADSGEVGTCEIARLQVPMSLGVARSPNRLGILDSLNSTDLIGVKNMNCGKVSMSYVGCCAIPMGSGNHPIDSIPFHNSYSFHNSRQGIWVAQSLFWFRFPASHHKLICNFLLPNNLLYENLEIKTTPWNKVAVRNVG